MIKEKPNIILTSERLIFRPHIMDDMDAFCAMEQDSEVRRYVGGSPRTREAAEQRFLSGIGHPANDNLSMWATLLKDSNIYIGRCGIYPHYSAQGEKIEGEGSIGFYIACEFWGQGFATEAGRAFVAFGFDELKLKRIVTSIEQGNDASVRVINKLGFKLEYIEPGPRTFLHFELKNY